MPWYRIIQNGQTDIAHTQTVFTFCWNKLIEYIRTQDHDSIISSTPSWICLVTLLMMGESSKALSLSSGALPCNANKQFSVHENNVNNNVPLITSMRSACAFLGISCTFSGYFASTAPRRANKTKAKVRCVLTYRESKANWLEIRNSTVIAS